MSIYRGLAIRILQAALVIVLFGAGWLIYNRLPGGPTENERERGATTIEIVMEPQAEPSGTALDIAVDFYPVDIVAVGHEYFTDRRAGKSFDDFRKERMKGRATVTTHLDRQGRGSVTLPAGNWWLYAKLSGDEELEWRLPVSVSGTKQIVQLNAQNAYTRSKAF
ncbi:MAG TPA: hypothetical protein VGQ39_11205 [Pyrinomonadaceae bacterium]|nr:hypothetical protein [Pyrinomonadaceae bacterium]